MKNIRLGLTFGIIGGLFTIIFGGWGVAVLGVAMGLGLGLSLSGRLARKNHPSW